LFRNPIFVSIKHLVRETIITVQTHTPPLQSGRNFTNADNETIHVYWFTFQQTTCNNKNGHRRLQDYSAAIGTPLDFPVVLSSIVKFVLST